LSKLRLRIFDGSRKPFDEPVDFLVTITDGNQTQHVRNYFNSNDITFDVPFFDGPGDKYTVVIWAKGYKQAGFVPVVLSDAYEKILDIMLVPDDPGFNFADAKWEVIAPLYAFLGSGVDATSGATRYSNLMENSEKSLACILNLCEAMSQISLSQGTPLDYIKEVQILIFTAHESGQLAQESRRVGARGYVTKSDAARQLVRAIETLLSGRTFFGGPEKQEAGEKDLDQESSFDSL
jgi:hypothetical protein